MEPVELLRIPFSHYSQKAEWLLSQAQIPYRTTDVNLLQMRDAEEFTRDGTVPCLIHAEGVLWGSDEIMEWASKNQRAGDRLMPHGKKTLIREWVAWADKEVGPVARRVAYRTLYESPFQADLPLRQRLLLRIGKPVILNVLKHYKARRFEATDLDEMHAQLSRVEDVLVQGNLLGTPAPTAADRSVAALLRPYTYVATPLGLHEQYPETMAWIGAMRRTTRRLGTSKFRKSDRERWTALATQAKS